LAMGLNSRRLICWRRRRQFVLSKMLIWLSCRSITSFTQIYLNRSMKVDHAQGGGKSSSHTEHQRKPLYSRHSRRSSYFPPMASSISRRWSRLSGPGSSPPAATRDTPARALHQRLMFMDRMNHLRPEIAAMYVALVNTLV